MNNCPEHAAVKVLKFGGTSVGTFDAVSRTMDIVASRTDSEVVVCVSALSKVTDLLYAISDAAASGDEEKVNGFMYELRRRHQSLAQSLLSADPVRLEKASEKINEICDTLFAVVRSTLTLGDVPDRIKAVIISNGEILSSTIICFALNSKGIRTGFADARTMIYTQGDCLCGEPCFDKIGQAVPKVVEDTFARGTAFPYEGKARDGQRNQVVITQGFIASNLQRSASVLGRGGSDYTASIIASALNASKVEIWTDVDGIQTTDPRICKGTRRIELISYSQAARMAYLGAKVLHPMTIAPAVSRNIPVYVLNTMNPECDGTAIVPEEESKGPKGIAFKRNLYVFSFTLNGWEQLKDKINDHLRPDVVAVKEDKVVMTVDFSVNLGLFLKMAAGVTDIDLRTGKGQISVVGKNLIGIAPELESRIPALAAHSGKLLKDSELSYIVDSSSLEDTIREIHSLLFN